MKNLFFSLLIVFTTGFAFSSEGVITCIKTENGITDTFEIYVKGSQISMPFKDGSGTYLLLLDNSAGQMKLCVDHPAFENKGYYLFNQENSVKPSIETYKTGTLPAKEIDGTSCEGHFISTDQGDATVYFGTESISLQGFSRFIAKPLFELLDASNTGLLPKLIEQDGTTIKMSFEAKTVDASVFNPPAGYTAFEVQTVSE